ncbi:transcription factor BIM2-like isoform X2 [Malania oleifera]|uniref:transcription factor BIM2-like isoform X2 n=1 Tax=Malania oleifera TaxID=397392 RepID=UPI0025AE64BB|nr:transcription factor BIM2-like isoform X2 [Malania oleifera]
MVKSSKSHQEEEMDDDKDFFAANLGSSQKGDAGSTIQQPTTPRSKHSVTEQRRRSKINERFQILRDLIPQNDQKRDKASFLLEVIEYIHFLQEKLQMYEGSYQGWSQEPTKLIPWRNNHGPVEGFADHSQVMMNGSGQENNAVTPTVLTNAEGFVESDLSTGAAYRAVNHSHGPATETIPLNVPLQPNMFPAGGRGAMPMQASFPDAEHMSSLVQCQLGQDRPCATEYAASSGAPNGQEFATENRAVNISNACSQGLLNTLTQALESSGVDISRANISVQIDVGKEANSRVMAMTYNMKDNRSLSPRNRAMLHSVVGSCVKDSDQAYKRVRTERRSNWKGL